MAFTVTAEKSTSRPKIDRPSRQADDSWKELLPLVREVMQLPADQSQPIKVLNEEASSVVTALRRCGEELNVTVRFKTFPVKDDNGEQRRTKPDASGKTKPVVTYHEAVGKSQTRLTFWTVAKIHRKPKNQDAASVEVE